MNCFPIICSKCELYDKLLLQMMATLASTYCTVLHCTYNAILLNIYKIGRKMRFFLSMFDFCAISIFISLVSLRHANCIWLSSKCKFLALLFCFDFIVINACGLNECVQQQFRVFLDFLYVSMIDMEVYLTIKCISFLFLN